jgi:phenylpyruvate tautomerase PptA (4-oxalocrotonate tautomerase family)/ketosteroid isomerase-like protein
MPIIRTSLLEGFATKEQESALAVRMADVVADTFGDFTKPYIFSIVDEVKPGSWSVQGQAMTEEMIAAGRAMSQDWLAKKLTPERVGEAYDALATGDRAVIEQYFDNNMTWLVPGEAPLISGLKQGLDDFLEFMKYVGDLSGGSFNMDRHSTFIKDGEWSVDLSHNTASRAGDPSRTLTIDVAHVLRWRDGKIIEARGAIFGTGTTEYNAFWA